MSKSMIRIVLILAGCFMPLDLLAYPLFGSEDTQIRRLESARLIEQGELRGSKQPAGALHPLDEIDIRLNQMPEIELPEADAALTKQLRRFIYNNLSKYSISVLDLSDPEQPVYAEHNGGLARNPGSVGKIMVATAVFQALAYAYPDDIEERKRVLRDTIITSDQFIISDHHVVKFWQADKNRVKRRPLRVGDQGSLWEYLDWMLSASSNAAASMVLKQAMLIRHFGKEYPVSDFRSDQLFSEMPRKELTQLLAETVQGPLIRNGINIQKLRQGSFFTRKGKQLVPGTNSYGTTRELMRLMLKIEQGDLVDEFSSREIKRLLYITERRIRYASHPALKDSAVYFKSGSLYKCEEDPDPEFVCEKYHGNVMNLMNSVAIIETSNEKSDLHYIVTLTSNILKENSAVAHQTLAMRIHRLLEKRHAK
ncbi:MAG: serine hydrolase [Gammaproteobacteria bacterium]